MTDRFSKLTKAPAPDDMNRRKHSRNSFHKWPGTELWNTAQVIAQQLSAIHVRIILEDFQTVDGEVANNYELPSADQRITRTIWCHDRIKTLPLRCRAPMRMGQLFCTLHVRVQHTSTLENETATIPSCTQSTVALLRHPKVESDSTRHRTFPLVNDNTNTSYSLAVELKRLAGTKLRPVQARCKKDRQEKVKFEPAFVPENSALVERSPLTSTFAEQLDV